MSKELNMNRTVLEIDKELYVPFEWRDKSLGRCEFEVCVKFRRGKMKEFWVNPAQSRLKNSYHYIGYCDNYFTINSFEGLGDSKVWKIAYCEEHKATMFCVYAPENAKRFCLNEYGLSFWMKDYTK